MYKNLFPLVVSIFSLVLFHGQVLTLKLAHFLLQLVVSSVPSQCFLTSVLLLLLLNFLATAHAVQHVGSPQPAMRFLTLCFASAVLTTGMPGEILL